MSRKNEYSGNLIYEINNLVPGTEIGITVHIGLGIISVSFFDIAHKIKLGKITRINSESEKMLNIVGGFSAETESLLNKALLMSLNLIIERFFENTHYLQSDVRKLVLCCPIAVEHILLGERFMTGNVFKASDFSLPVDENAEVYIVPFISTEIGGDLLCAECAVPTREKTLILMLEADAKLVYIDNDRIVGCSVPLCPFFDGLDYDDGMPVTKGAIDGIWRSDSGEMCYSVVGDCPSRGIAPSGVLDGVKLMLDEGIIDGDGTMIDRDMLNVGEDFFLSQKSVRAAQGAKAKLFSTIKAFMNELDVSEGDIKNVFISGYYAKKLNEKQLYDLNFIPEFKNAKLAFTQDAAELGLLQILYGEITPSELDRIAIKTEIVNEFDDEFLDAAYMAGILF